MKEPVESLQKRLFQRLPAWLKEAYHQNSVVHRAVSHYLSGDIQTWDLYENLARILFEQNRILQEQNERMAETQFPLYQFYIDAEGNAVGPTLVEGENECANG